jgi:drug/metabolite transporter (DMT)-like permease
MNPSSGEHDQLLLGTTYGLITVLIWAAFPIITKISLQQQLTPMEVAILRYASSGLILLPFLLRRGIAGLPLKAIILLVCGAGLPYMLMSTGGLQYSSASHFGMITPSTMLLCTTLGGFWLFGESLDRTKLLGIGAVITGLVLVAINGFHAGESTWQGDLMFVAAGALWAIYTLSLRHWQIEPMRATALVATVSMLLSVPAFWLMADSGISTASWGTIATQIGYQGILSSILALVFYSRAVAMLGPSRGAVFGAMVPGMALLLAVIVLGEEATALQYAGVVIIFSGVITVLGLWPKNLLREKRPT